MRYPRETLLDLNREVEMMSDPDKWPAWPFLPLKKPGQSAKTGEYAYLYNDDLNAYPKITCFKGLMYDHKPDNDRVEFASFTELLNQGWRVD
jgi:hypothetical protein